MPLPVETSLKFCLLRSACSPLSKGGLVIGELLAVPGSYLGVLSIKLGYAFKSIMFTFN